MRRLVRLSSPLPIAVAAGLVASCNVAAFSGALQLSPDLSSRRGNRSLSNYILYSSASGANEIDGDANAEAADESSSTVNNASKREMLKFAVPALGIYLTNPLLSNIDNAFVGRTVGALGLAALSPATLCIDQILYLFSFLSRAATALAARAYNAADNKSEEEAKERMREASAPALSVAVFSGVLMSILYALKAPAILHALNVDPALRTSATAYIHWRGLVSWAAMAQAILLTVFMVAKDAVTPLKIIAGAAALNVLGDGLFCAWPLRMGCGGAAAATALATLVSSGWMVQSLKKRNMLPPLKVPNKSECLELLSFTGPLLAITLTRMAGFVNMQRRAMLLGSTEMLAGYQLCSNLLIFFILFGEPLSQLGQTKMPALIDSGDTGEALATFKSILVLSSFAAIGVGAAAYLTAFLGPGMFSSSVGVQAVAKATAPMLFSAVSTTIVGIAVDGMAIASRDFGFMLASGLASFVLQAKLLTFCQSVGEIFGTFTIRLAIYALFTIGRAGMGWGPLGRAIRGQGGKSEPAVAE
ncbi:hypothetical protein ACHAXT_011967 [Thalassiosira profunda]